MATRKKAARKVRKIARKRARATRKVVRKVRKVARKRARATRKAVRKVAKVARKRAGAVRKAARKAARSMTAPPVRERIAPIARTPVAMPVAMPTHAPIRPEGLRPASLFDRDVPEHDED